ncbi:MAG: MerR family DNA-binding transcriptional regulator [Dinoroseobacter sp.]|nr:MerR family DNA-binding transcriptional regulator [Dinoroseobacter sp.]NQZ72275.1 MerR family DNA-binding transcriptional regulator [Dinoroseobacter sp.]
MAEKQISFKEMCEKFDVTPRTLRYYEYIELLQPIREGRTRWYTPREVARMTLILRGRRFGFALEDIRQWLLIYDQDGSDAQNEAWIELADRQLKDLAVQREELEATVAELQSLRETIARQISQD